MSVHTADVTLSSFSTSDQQTTHTWPKVVTFRPTDRKPYRCSDTIPSGRQADRQTAKGTDTEKANRRTAKGTHAEKADRLTGGQLKEHDRQTDRQLKEQTLRKRTG